MSWLATIGLALALWIGFIIFWWAVVMPWLRNGPRRDATTGLIWRVLRLAMRLIHRPRYEGLEELRDDADVRPLIVVSNHTGSVDPLLIQCGCRFHIRWMMADNQMIPILDWLWKRERIIPVARSGEDTAALREAIRHVKEGGNIGVFPEGRIVYPRGQVWPFFEGVGLMVRRTDAPVMLVWVSGTPESLELSGVRTPSHARIRYLEIIEYDRSMSATEITADLRRRLSEASGWPIVDETPPFEISRADPFNQIKATQPTPSQPSVGRMSES